MLSDCSSRRGTSSTLLPSRSRIRAGCACSAPRRRAALHCRAGEPASSETERAPEEPQKALREPVLLTSTSVCRVPVADAGGEVALNRYMRLPVEQYFVLDPSTISRLGPNHFRCTIPRMSFLSVWLEPEVEVQVYIREDRVHMRSVRTRLRGSDFVERANLNAVFDMFWSTTLTWGDGEGDADGGRGHINVSTELKVWCEVLPPFHLMPRRLLAGACNSVLRRAIPALLDAFTRSLAADYVRWSADEAYRDSRRDAAAAVLAGEASRGENGDAEGALEAVDASRALVSR